MLKTTFQTPSNSKWGCLQIQNSVSGHRQIKTLGINLSWVISNYDGLPVHTITVYIPPMDVAVATLILRQISWIIKSLVLPKYPNFKIIIMKDFNLIAIEKKKFLKKIGLKAVVPDGQSTHN